ncbi:hypothetical protein K493DRAFT_295545 [Basidiobolus meristosporus CBS 931.73]|uniref:Uncharacterized protein n=1 Tax=Basidiobolus meristosporus CBS 931.73 TaxID=1314790 RepID=A0A1Y1ZAY3_9FUNG|nr:hypothetical protein K493DRAFT_295545 [Basidiobolus meristosporus CBS 931.73]|eukprot:ORY07336.1 hypothetical protein K493DRAFT_295545 [Basidiobolus meristosporus CBS 931.73]
MTIFPTHISEKAPPLGAVCSGSNPTKTTQYMKREIVNPLLYAKRDAYSSFAPCIDSSSASLSSQDTAALYYFKKRKVDAAKCQNMGGGGVALGEHAQIIKHTVVDGSGVAKNVDIATNGEESSQEAAEPNPGSLFLEENAKLLLKLADYQDARTKGDYSAVAPIEHATAKAFVSRMMYILPTVKPSALVSSEGLEDAINRIPIPEPTYRGTLPPNKPFAYATNSALGKSFSTNATTVPTSHLPRS